MKRYIHVTKEVREFLAKVFKVTDRTVWYAITFEKDNQLHRKIQMLAIKKGGILMNELPALETFHDHDGYMRQYLPNGALLELGKTPETKGGAVFFKGKKVREYKEVMVSDILDIQNWAMTLR